MVNSMVRRFFIVLAICAFLWLTVLCLNWRRAATKKGFNELGFPFVFYREANGNEEAGQLELGVNYKNLITDIGIVLLIPVIVIKLMEIHKQQ